MKKTIALALALALCLWALTAPAEETEIPEEIRQEIEAAQAEADAQQAAEAAPSPTGEWYTEISGLAVTLTLKEDGTYLYDIPALPGEPEKGTWEWSDGYVRLDGEDDTLFSFGGDRLACQPLGLFLTREPAETYAPAEPDPEVPPEEYSGYWRSAYIGLNGAAMESYGLDDTEIYIEGTTAALGGSIFGDAIAGFTFENGGLHYTGEGMSIRLEYQKDGLLRLTAEGGDAPLVLYLYPDYPETAADREAAAEMTKLKELMIRCYRYALGREGAKEEIVYWVERVVKDGKTVAEVVHEIFSSVEYQNRKPGNEETVKALYLIFFDREADEGGLAAWAGMLNNGETLEKVIEGFSESEEFKALMSKTE